MKFLITVMALAISGICMSQHVQTNEMLLGAIQNEALKARPYSDWFTTGYNEYTPEAGIVQALKAINTKDITIEVYFGTWCGDSRRELPRFMKLVDEVAFPQKNVKLIAVGDWDSLYKQSPQHEESGKGVFRVPLFVVYHKGKEINRINEYPVFSLERDLHQILSHNAYTPNYKTFPLIRTWIKDGTLSNSNISTRGLAMQLKPLVAGEGELNSIGYLMLKHGSRLEALKIFQVNSILFPQSATILSSLAEGYLENGENANAVVQLEKALELNKNPQEVKELLKLLYRAKGVKE